MKILAFSALCLLTGCGYTLHNRLKSAFSLRNAIFVPVFENQTDEVGVEPIFTNALIRELHSRQEVNLTDREKADHELKGVLTSITYDATASTTQPFGGLQSYRRLPSELGVRVGLRLTLIRKRDGVPVWHREFSGFRRVAAPVERTFDYDAPSSIGLTTQSTAESIYEVVARDIMRDVYDEMVAF